MRRRYILISLLALTTAICAQDVQRLSEDELTGTARYVGMGGAMTAIGGDPSAAMVNPAGLGVYRRMEIEVSFDGRIENMHQIGTSGLNRSKVTVPQASWVFTFGNLNKATGVICNNLMFNYQRLRTFDRQFTGSLSAQGRANSITSMMADFAQGIAEEKLVNNSANLNNSSVGWLSIMGYNNYLINPVTGKDNTYESLMKADETYEGYVNSRESGSVNQFAFDWGINISHRWFFGAGLNIISYDFSQSVYYKETFKNGGYVSHETSLGLSGVGVSGVFGFLLHPVQILRIGASIQTPTASTTNIQQAGAMSALTDTTRSVSLNTGGESTSSYNMPLRVSASAALQLTHYGVLAFQYDYRHSSRTNDLHTLRAGLEVVPINNLFINLGYVYEFPIRKNPGTSPVNVQPNEIRTDTYGQDLHATQYVSAGLGYRGNYLTCQAAYQYRWDNVSVYPTQYSNPMEARINTHRIVVTLSWHTK